jgi:hypothetical protein
LTAGSADPLMDQPPIPDPKFHRKWWATGALHDRYRIFAITCPFALLNTEGRRRVTTAYQAEPEAGVTGLVMEHLAVSLNSRQGLTVFQFPNRPGRSRHGHPARVRKKIPSITSR